MGQWLIFTDLDGTLLDAQTYRWEPATEGLTIIHERNIPLIPSTSKTHLEVEDVLQKLDLKCPFITENGSAVFIPQYECLSADDTDERIGPYRVKILGQRREQVLGFLRKLKSEFNLSIRSFSEMTLKEISRLTGLSQDEAIKAKERLFSEPFILTQKTDMASIRDYCEKHGFRLLRGNRFYHLLGDSNKGKAARYVKKIYQADQQKGIKTMALGDSPNDFEMLLEVDQPVLVRKYDGSYAKGLNIDKVYQTKAYGPAGWNEAILKFLI